MANNEENKVGTKPTPSGTKPSASIDVTGDLLKGLLEGLGQVIANGNQNQTQIITDTIQKLQSSQATGNTSYSVAGNGAERYKEGQRDIDTSIRSVAQDVREKMKKGELSGYVDGMKFTTFPITLPMEKNILTPVKLSFSFGGMLIEYVWKKKGVTTFVHGVHAQAVQDWINRYNSPVSQNRVQESEFQK